MESLPLPAIGGDFLVAIDAKPRLSSTRKRLMAIAAFCLELGMPFDKRAWHDELFQQILSGDAAGRSDEKCRSKYQCAFETADQR